MSNENQVPEVQTDQADASRRDFVKKASVAAAAVPAVALLASLRSTPLSAQGGYGAV